MGLQGCLCMILGTGWYGCNRFSWCGASVRVCGGHSRFHVAAWRRNSTVSYTTSTHGCLYICHMPLASSRTVAYSLCVCSVVRTTGVAGISPGLRTQLAGQQLVRQLPFEHKLRLLCTAPPAAAGSTWR